MPIFDLCDKKVFVAGHRGMVGSSIVRALLKRNVDVITACRTDVDLRHQGETLGWFKDNMPDVVVVAAARVGGILANSSFPKDFLFDNLMIASNVIDSAFQAGTKKLLFLGSSCIYPKFAEQPIKEVSLLTGLLEPTNEWYALAKIAGIKLAQAYRVQHGVDFISAMPCNLYGPGDNYHPEHSHVIGGLIQRLHKAKMGNDSAVTVWGTGQPRREFLYVDDLADACIFLLENYSDTEHINVGTGEDLTIADLARKIAEVVGCRSKLEFDPTRPDGTPRKLMDVSRLSSLGWKSSTTLEFGLTQSYADFCRRYGCV